jgi:hypothetical protein
MSLSDDIRISESKVNWTILRSRCSKTVILATTHPHAPKPIVIKVDEDSPRVILEEPIGSAPLPLGH